MICFSFRAIDLVIDNAARKDMPMKHTLNFSASGQARAERLLTTAEAAQVLGLSPAFLANLRVKGGGPRFFKLGHAVRYSRGQLTEWMTGRERASTSQ